ncbi:MAG TPA: heavy metal translocating P-type ATPase [Anaeromyxobacter sp.]
MTSDAAAARATLRCDHCLVEFPAREAVRETIAGAERVFCCNGCRGVFRLVQEEGLGAYYETRRWDGPGAPAGEAAAAPDLAAFRDAVRHGEGEDEIEVYVDGIRCASCVWLNERVLQRTPGVRLARVNYATHRARIRWDPARADLARVLGRIRAAGYEPRPWSDTQQAAARRAEQRDLLVRLGTAAFLASQLMIYQAALYAGYFQGIDAATRRLMEWISLGLALPVYLYSGWPFLRSTARGLRRFRFDMDALVAIGSGAALAYSAWQMWRGGEVYFDTAVTIPTLVLVGRYLEAAARGRASEAVARLARLAPREARRLVRHADGREERRAVPVGELAVGDLVEVHPGERVPLDGAVVEGASEVDESLVTGEARRVAKAPGAPVIGGTVNLHGALAVRVTRVGKDTVLAGIVRAVEEAQAAKPRIQAVADRVVGVFVPAMLVLAAGTLVTWLARGATLERALMTGISVVVIACPCALGLATPIAVLVATGAATARGLLLRGGDVLERAARVTDVLLDKTGTATRGRPALSAVVPVAPGLSRDGALALAAAVERRSEHHVARAIVEAARALPDVGPFEVEGFRAIAGRGVTATVTAASAAPTATPAPNPWEIVLGNRALLADHGIAIPPDLAARAEALESGGDTVALLAVGGAVAALLAVADPVRDEAAEAIAALRAAGLRVSIVSGDGRVTTAAVAGRLAVEAISEASPTGKREVVARLQAAGRRVLFVGDGVNDAPALTQADVGVAMGRGTDVTLESADAVLVREDLRLLPELVRRSRGAYAVIRQNVFWAFFYNAIAIPLAMAGVLHPIVAAAAMACSSVFVVGNSLRLDMRRRWGPGQRT